MGELVSLRSVAKQPSLELNNWIRTNFSLSPLSFGVPRPLQHNWVG